MALGVSTGAQELEAQRPAAARERLHIEVPEGPAEAPAQDVAPIGRDVLKRMYARELGKQYDPADADRLYEAHQLIEAFFAEPTAKARQDIIGKIRDTKLDANLLG